MAYSVFRVPNGTIVTPTGAAQVVSTVQGYSGQTADLQQWQNSSSTNLARILSDGSISGVNGTFSGDVAVNGGDLTTSASTFNLLTGASTINVGQLAGTIDLKGSVNIGSGLVVQGNLTVNGTTTTVNSTVVSIDDLNFNVAADVTVASNADGAGLTVGNGLGITMNYDHANTAWTSSQNFNIATGKTYKIAGTDVLSATTLGAGVVSSSLAKVGTIATGVWQGSSISTTYTDAKVVSVTSAGAARISVGGTTANPTIDLATVSQGAGGSFVKVTLDSYGRVTQNTAVTSADITGVLGYTPANSGSVLSGTGSANKIAYWSGSTALTYDSDLAYDAANNILQIGNNHINGSASGIAVSNTITQIDSFAAATYRSAKYVVQVSHASAGYQVSEILVVHDGTTAYVTEYGVMYTGATPLITYSATISAGNVLLQGTGANTSNTVRFTRVTMSV